MLKTTGSFDESAPSKNNGSRSVSNRNDNSRPATRKNHNNSEINGFGFGRSNMKYAKKSGKLSKSGKLKSKKTSKSWNLAKSRKKLSKNENSTNYNVTEAEPKFLTPNARITFNCLRLIFTEVPILWYFDLRCHIWIETDVLSYTISGILG